MADIFYTDANLVDGAPATPAARASRRRLRNWHKFTLTAGMTQIGGALLLHGLTASWLVTSLGLAVWLLADLLILFVAWRLNRL